MRVVGGSARGRRLLSPRGGDIRPMPDRVRQALFNILGRTVVGARVLDLFSGTGALGIEALSRGATACLFVENDRMAVRLIEENLRRLGFAEAARVWQADALQLAPRLAAIHEAFDLVFAGPPYRLLEEAKTRAALMQLFAQLNLQESLSPAAVIVLQHPADVAIDAAPAAGLVCTDQRRYGRTALTFLERPPHATGPQERPVED